LGFGSPANAATRIIEYAMISQIRRSDTHEVRRKGRDDDGGDCGRRGDSAHEDQPDVDGQVGGCDGADNERKVVELQPGHRLAAALPSAEIGGRSDRRQAGKV
jgi:hypothetical protein